MKNTTMALSLTAALLSISLAQAGEFSGGWVGGKIGTNRSDVTGVPAVGAKNSTTLGLEGGYNWDISNFLLGVDGFADFNQKATHTVTNYGSDVYGLDLKLGLPAGNWLPYAKLGYAHASAKGAVTGSGNGVHYGLGIEYKFAPQWSVAGEYSAHSGKGGTAKLNNDNFTIGLNYYFNEPYVAPVVPVAPPVVKREMPVVQAAPAKPVPVEAAPAKPAPESWKTLLEEKPVALKGTNFNINSAKLRPTADALLGEVVEFANVYKDAKLDVSGHTCSLGSEKYNQKLSERRAASVKAYLVKKGVAADRIVTEGYGETKPVADNNTQEGREMNRRVEIRSVIKEETRVRVVN